MRWNPVPPLGRWLAPGPRRLLAVLGPDAASAGQSLVALGINSSTSLVAGAALGAITDTLARHPGLLVMVPAAVGLRGNVFSALGSRVSTAVHAGAYRPSLRRGSVVGDNVAASVALTLLLALVLALVAKVVADVFGVPGEVSVLDLVTISVLGGVLASVVVLGATLALVVLAVRRAWDLDNLVAPVVSTLGDVVTVPSLWLASHALGYGSASRAVGFACIAVGFGAGLAAWRSRQERTRRIVRESVPVLTIAVCLSALAGVVLEQQFETFSRYPALLVLVPAFVSSAGALGGMLTSGLATSLHLGTVVPTSVPDRSVRAAMRVLCVLAVPIYLFNGLGSHLVAGLLGEGSPGALAMIAAALLGAVGAVAFVLGIAYYGTLGAQRLRVDPDTYGIPIVTSSVDFLGALTLVAAVGFLPIT